MSLRSTLNRAVLASLLLFSVTLGPGCPIDPNSSSCCLFPDNTVLQTQASLCASKQGVPVATDACTERSNILTTLCQRYVGFCAQSVGFCVNTWKDKIKANAPWYQANKCLQELVLSSSDFCTQGNNCFQTLEQGKSEVTVQAPDGTAFSTKVTLRSTSQSLEMAVEMNESRSLVITIHSTPAKEGTYSLAQDNSRGATVLYTDNQGEKHPSISGTLTLSEIKDNRVSGSFQYKNEANQTIEGTLLSAPLPQ
ncbi:MAG: hypothetical protein EP343_29585 [Deltaproteobacteria bacterium]|nr:MAG: hypothetical protein EP343_29585 [Deltaproteobacteria bacterium]